tara:strand:+ start:719 stop:928 length:210 start_codon:yes stop_codon:yes gene_type:complete
MSRLNFMDCHEIIMLLQEKSSVSNMDDFDGDIEKYSKKSHEYHNITMKMYHLQELADKRKDYGFREEGE